MKQSTNGSSRERCQAIELADAGCSSKMKLTPGFAPVALLSTRKEIRMLMNKTGYHLSFTSGGLCLYESRLLAELYLDLGDWQSVRDKAISDNLLQARTISSLTRSCREVISRLKTLHQAELAFLVQASPQEQAYLLWIAVCRRYPFIAEFAIEVLRERYITLKNDLAFDHFDAFYNRKSEWHPELDKISTTTRNKLRQVLFRMLREADLLTSGNSIKSAMLTQRLLTTVKTSASRDLLYFPVFESELKGLLL